MLLDVESVEDFKQYYAGSFCKGREPGTVYRLPDRRDKTVRNYMERFVDGKFKENVFFDELASLGSYIYFGIPSIGMMVYKNELIYLYHTPSRTGRRGFTSERVNMRSFNSDQLMNIERPVVDESYLSRAYFVQVALFPKHTTLKDAVLDFNSDSPKRLAYSLSRQFGTYIDAVDGPVLCYKTERVGTVSVQNGVPIISLRGSKHELRDVIGRDLLDMSYKVEVI